MFSGGHFLFTSSVTFAEDVSFSHSTLWKTKAPKFPRLEKPVTMAIPDAAFSAVRFCSYTIHVLVPRTQYDRPS